MPQGPWEKYQQQPEGPWSQYQTAGQRGAPPRPQPVAPSVPASDYGLSEMLPSGRTALRMGGATVGGLLGAGGGPPTAIGGAALGGATGDSLYQLIQRARGASDAPQSSTEAAEGVGIGGLEGGLQEAVGQFLPRAGRSIASRLYRTALKPSTTLTAPEAEAVSSTLLKNRIPISGSGSRKLQDMIGGLNRQIESEIATNPTAPIDPRAVASRVTPVEADLTYQDLARDAAAAAEERTRFLSAHQAPIEAARGQAMKKAIYKEVYPADSPSGYELARKAEGRGLKEELQALFPNIQGLNAQEGQLLDAAPQLTRAVNRTENRDVVGIGAPIMAGAAHVLSQKPSLAIAMALAKNAGSRTAILADILSHPVMGVTPAALPRFGVIPALSRFSGSGNQ